MHRPRRRSKRNQRFTVGLGGRDAGLLPYRLPVVATRPAALRADAPYFIVFPGAGWSGRQWPAARFAAVLDHVARTRGWLPVLCGSAAEHPLCSEVDELAKAPVVNLAGTTSLPEFCEAVRGARLLIGNETSAVHIAAAVATPSVCLLGGGHFGRFIPYPAGFPGAAPEPVFERMPCFGCDWVCHLPHTAGAAMPCVGAIDPSAVLAAVDRVLARTAGREAAFSGGS